MELLRLLETLRTPLLDGLMQLITLFGEETLFMVAAMVFFWCIDKRTGYFLLYVNVLGASVNQLLKLVFCVPRPWVLDPEFTIVESAREAATGYSFPSGHTQSAGGMFFGLARLYKGRGLRIACVAMVLLVGFSRMYLGVHTPADVAVSLAVSALLVLAAAPLFERAWRDGRWRALLLGALLAAAAALTVYADFCPRPAGAIAEFSDAGVETAYKMLGASLGYALVLWLDTEFIRFPTRAVWWAQALKVAAGLALVVVVRTLLKAPLLALCGGHAAAHALRYFLMMVTGGAVWPLSFRWFAALGAGKA